MRKMKCWLLRLVGKCRGKCCCCWSLALASGRENEKKKAVKRVLLTVTYSSRAELQHPHVSYPHIRARSVASVSVDPGRISRGVENVEWFPARKTWSIRGDTVRQINNFVRGLAAECIGRDWICSPAKKSAQQTWRKHVYAQPLCVPWAHTHAHVCQEICVRPTDVFFLFVCPVWLRIDRVQSGRAGPKF